MSVAFWVRYVLLKEERDDQPRAVTLQQIEAKYGTEMRQEIEARLASAE